MQFTFFSDILCESFPTGERRILPQESHIPTTTTFNRNSLSMYTWMLTRLRESRDEKFQQMLQASKIHKRNIARFNFVIIHVVVFQSAFPISAYVGALNLFLSVFWLLPSRVILLFGMHPEKLCDSHLMACLII